MALVADNEGLAMKEPVLEPANLHLAGAKPLHKTSGGAIRLDREAEQVPILRDASFMAFQGTTQPGALSTARYRRLFLQSTGPTIPRVGFSTQ